MIILSPSPSNGLSDDTAQIQAAINKGADTIYLAPGTYSISKPLVLQSNCTILGQVGGTTIQSRYSDIFTASGTLTGCVFGGFTAISHAGGGHIFNLDGCSVSECEWKDLVLTQQNPGKSVLSCQGVAAGFFGNWLHDFVMSYVANTAPAINIACGTVNQLRISSFRSTGNAGSTSPAIWLEQQATSAGLCCEVHQGTFELPYGGAVTLLTMMCSSISHCGVYDTSTPAAPLFHVAKSTFASAAPSSNLSLDHIFSTVGTSSNPDVYLEADVAGQGSFALAWSKVNYLKGGVSGAGNAIALLNAAVNNSVNATTTTLA